MLIDYLRYLAFGGRLRGFFDGGLYNYVEPTSTTGQHLRFAPDDLAQRLGWRGHEIVHHLYWDPHSKDLIFERLTYDMGLAGRPDSLITPPFEIGGRPATFVYRERSPPRVEIIIDIDPDHWNERYSEPGTYEDVRIIYRRAGPAKATFESGDKLLDEQRRQAGHGTLCGVFCSANGPRFALTCGHVAANASRLVVEQPRRIWKLQLWSSFTSLGAIRHVTIPALVAGPPGPARTQLDAALVEVGSDVLPSVPPKETRLATIKPISTILQEEPVRFRGAGRAQYTPARVAAITIRKSMDLLKTGMLHDVGDVLMLGHRHPMYFVQRVSRPGDSGAAIRQDFSSVGPFAELNQWHGMILGSDEAGAYATYAEHLWAWAAQQISDPEVEFVFET